MNHEFVPLVSAIIITYKRPVDILMRAVSSAISQTYRNLEIIIVNDCPEEQKLAGEIGHLLDSLNDQRIRYIVHENNAGACAARNTGILAAHGDHIALLDDDDEWLPQKIETQLTGFADPEVGLVFSPFYNFPVNKERILAIRSKKSGYIWKDMLFKNRLGGCSMSMVRREAYETCGLFDTNLPAGQDFDMWLRISLKYKVKFIEEPLTNRYMQNDSITFNHNKKMQAFNYLLEKHKSLYQDYPKALNYRYSHQAGILIGKGYWREAMGLYKSAIRTRPFSRYNVTEIGKGLFNWIKRRF